MFETIRCSINSLQKSDYLDVRELFVNQGVRKFLGGICQEDSIKATWDEMLHSGVNSFYWVVREKHADHFMGLVSLDLHHKGHYLEISYQFLPNWWGKGYATEVIQSIITFALNELKLAKIVAETQTTNISSCRLLEKLGMKLEAKLTGSGQSKPFIRLVTLVKKCRSV